MVMHLPHLLILSGTWRSRCRVCCGEQMPKGSSKAATAGKLQQAESCCVRATGAASFSAKLNKAFKCVQLGWDDTAARRGSMHNHKA